MRCSCCHKRRRTRRTCGRPDHPCNRCAPHKSRNDLEELEERYEEIGENLIQDPEALNALAEAPDAQTGLEIIASSGLRIDVDCIDPSGIIFVIQLARTIKKHGMQWKLMGKALARAAVSQHLVLPTLSYLASVWPCALACTIS